jgi:hypothetical protein
MDGSGVIIGMAGLLVSLTATCRGICRQRQGFLTKKGEVTI